MPKKPGKLVDVDFPHEFPGHEVAAHEVFMSFNADDEAVWFREWWNFKGQHSFAEFVREMERKDVRRE